jgi:hypothetical protein
MEATWTLSPAEHCQTCIDREGHVEIIRVYKDIQVPEYIGFYCEAKEYVEKGGQGSGNFGHSGRPGEVGGSGEDVGKNVDVDTSLLPLARGANWADLRDTEYRDYLRGRAGKGKFSEIVPQLDKLNQYASDDAYKLDEAQVVYFGIDSAKLSNLKPGDTFNALGTRSTTNDISRAAKYGKNVFELKVPAGTHAVNAKVFDIRELMLLPGAKFEVSAIKSDRIVLRLLDDGASWVQDLYKFQEELRNLANKG